MTPRERGSDSCRTTGDRPSHICGTVWSRRFHATALPCPTVGHMSPSDDCPALSDTWMTIPEAATVLGCSPRTVERRLARGELRRQERDGRVLVAIPDSLRRPADRMVEAVQQDAAHMRQLSAAVTQATEQAGMVLREAVTQARADAAAAIERAVQAEQGVRQAWRVSAALAAALVGALSVTVTVWVVRGEEVARSRQEARQLSDTMTKELVEARERAYAARAGMTVQELRGAGLYPASIEAALEADGPFPGGAYAPGHRNQPEPQDQPAAWHPPLTAD